MRPKFEEKKTTKDVGVGVLAEVYYILGFVMDHNDFDFKLVKILRSEWKLKLKGFGTFYKVDSVL